MSKKILTSNGKILAIDGTIVQGDFPEMDITKVIDGSLEHLIIPEGCTKIANYKFYSNTSLKSIDFSNVTGNITLNSHAFYNCTGLTELDFSNKTITCSAYTFARCNNINNIKTNPNQNFYTSEYTFQYCGQSGTGFELVKDFDSEYIFNLGPYSFQYSGVKKIQGRVKYIGDYVFNNCTLLEEVNIICESQTLSASGYMNCTNLKKIKIVTGSSITDNIITNNTFNGCKKVETFDIEGITSLTSIGNYAFRDFGNQRENIDTPLVLDFSRFTFTSAPQYGFYGVKNTYVYLPSTVTNVYANCFAESDGLTLFIDSIPTLANINAFTNTKNLKIFVNYNYIDTIMTKTNWSTYKEHIKGYITGVETLPTLTTGGIDIVWFYDSEFTQLVQDGDIIDVNSKYYCNVGPASLTNIETFQCSVNVADTNGNVYVQGDTIPLGTKLTLTFIPSVDTYIPYAVTINNVSVEIPSDNVYNVVMTDDLNISAVYWDGTNLPLDPVFSNNTWELIAAGIHGRAGYAIGWKIGDTKSVTLTNGETYTIRLCDTLEGRYAYSDGSGSSNGVLEFVELTTAMYRMNEYNKGNSGGWAECEMKNNTMPIIYDMLPDNLKSLIPSVVVSSSISGSNPSLSESGNHLFLPSEYEIFGKISSSNSIEQTTQFELYSANNTNNFRRRYVLNSEASGSYSWPLRSPSHGASYNWCIVTDTGGVASTSAGTTYHVAPVFTL